MKKLFFFTSAMTIILTAVAQQPVISGNPFPKTITVSGSAEMEIIPDQIYVNIELKEYQKKGEDKKDLEVIKSDFLASCKAVGIPDSAISISSYSGFSNYYYGIKKDRKKQPDLLASITYQVKFSSSKLMDALVEKLDDEATKNFLIFSASHSKMTEFRKQLKIQAIKAAKEKGIYLTEAIGEKLGVAITINEPDETNELASAYRINNSIYSNEVNKFFKDEVVNDKAELNFKKIKLRYEVTVVFSL